MATIISVILGNLKYDWWILAFAVGTAILYWGFVKRLANKLYENFNPRNRIDSLSEQGKKNIKNNTRNHEEMSDVELMETREKLNRVYSWFTNLTTMFPLFGMLGTVMSLIPMVDSIGTSNTTSFFTALTSTFWGIIFAITFKICDANISFKIEDNEKHLEYLIFPKDN